MANLADIMVQSALQSSQKVGEGTADSFAKGAELALKREALEQENLKLQQEKEKVMLAKFEKLGQVFDTYSKMPEGAGKKAYGKNFIPNFIVANGFDKVIDPTVMEMMQGEPALAAFWRAEITNGRMTMEDLMNVMKDPTMVAKQLPAALQEVTAAQMQSTLDDYSEGFVKANEERQKNLAQQQQLEAASKRQQTEIAATGPQEVAKQTAKDYSQFQTKGGLANINSRLKKLQQVLSDLESGKLVTGKGITVLPYGASEGVLARLDPKLKAAADDVQGAVNIKEQLGGQFTEREAFTQYQRAFDPRLPTAQNITKIRATIDELKQNVENKVSAFREQGFKVDGSIDLGNAGQPPTPPQAPAQAPAGANSTGVAQFDANPQWARSMKAALQKSPKDMQAVAAQLGITVQQLQQALERIK